MKNCVDIVEPFVNAMRDSCMPDIQLLGGIGSAALSRPETVIDMTHKVVIADTELEVPQFRDDGNLRDVDVLVLSPNALDLRVVQEQAEQTIDDQLEISVFGLHDVGELRPLEAHPFGVKALKTFLSDRYVGYWDEPYRYGVKALHPFSVPLNAEAMETWQLRVGSLDVPIAHPGATLLNYLTRSISGLRTKDTAKVQAMAAAIFDKAPEVADWMVDGPGREQLELARVFHTLREPRDHPQTLDLNMLQILPLDYGSLLSHEAFSIPTSIDDATRARVLAVARAKSRTLHALESNPRIVTLFQRVAEKRLDTVTKNR